jgi:hypothetical protein
MAMAMERRVMWEMKFEGEKRFDGSPNKLVKEEDSSSRAASKVFATKTGAGKVASKAAKEEDSSSHAASKVFATKTGAGKVAASKVFATKTGAGKVASKAARRRGATASRLPRIWRRVPPARSLSSRRCPRGRLQMRMRASPSLWVS